MFPFLRRHKTSLAYIAIVLVLVSVIAAQVPAGRQQSLLAWGVLAVIAPVQQVVFYALAGASEIWKGYIDLRETHLENAELRREIASLMRENQRLQETVAIAGDLMEMEAFKEYFQYREGFELLSAGVIGAGVAETANALVLNKGSLDGVEENQGVICPTGAVGKIISVGPTSCVVQLITDPRFAMAARDQRTRAGGILHGTGEETCELLYVRDNYQITAGSPIVASGLEGIFPNTVPIGSVSNVGPGEPPFQKIRVKPSCDLRTIEWVFIVQRRPERGGGG